MGAEAQCTVRFNGRVSDGKALLETDALIFRGTFRLAIPYATMTRVAAESGQLEVAFPEGVARFDLGVQAGTWAEKILHPKGLLDKLGVKPGMQAAVLGIDDPAFFTQLAGRTARVTRGRVGRGMDLIFIGVGKKQGLRRLASLASVLRPDGAIWMVAPRGSTGVREPDVLSAGKSAGLVDVKVVRFSDTHTAHKFVIPVAKRKRRTQ